MRASGLGLPFLAFIPIIASAAGSVSSALATRIGAGGPHGPTAAETLAMQMAAERRQRETLVLVAAGGVLLVFVVAAMR